MRTIRKYKNRKLYDVENSAYVTLPEIGELVREGETIVVVNSETNEDITSQVLFAIILENEKKFARDNLVNTHPDFLSDIIRSNDGTFGSYYRGMILNYDNLKI
jgi:polyhydroxyalkanoate synthesis repressor PhaR